MSITFVVPGPAQGKGRPRIGRVGNQARMFTPDKTVRYENLVATVAHEAMAGKSLMEGPVRVTMTINCVIPESWSKKKKALAVEGDVRPTTKPDVDNVIKAVFDAINGIVWKDDVQAVELKVSKYYTEMPCVWVTVEAV